MHLTNAESIGPELDVKISTTQKRPHGVGESSVGTFNRSVLMGSITTGRKQFIAERLEQIKNIWVVEEFSTLIDMNILVTTIRAMLREKMSEPFYRSSFRDATVSVFHPSKVISDKDPTSFTMETSIINTPF